MNFDDVTRNPRFGHPKMAEMADDEEKYVDLTAEDDEEVDIQDGQDEEDTTEEDACCICQDAVSLVKQGFLPSCDHRFHFDCIVTWSKVTNLCPLCKLKFNHVTRRDEQGNVVHTERVADTKQVFRPDPQDHDVAAQLRLVNNVRCESCGRGDDEHVLLMCEAPNCMNASHTYCAGLSEVPSHSWYCTVHQGGPARASDLIARPASTVSTRRRTRRLASLMSNIMSGVGAIRPRAVTTGSATGGRARRRGGARLNIMDGEGTARPIRGVALAYAAHMSRELQAIQHRADAMFARGDLARSTLYARPSGSILGSARSTTDRIWDDYALSRRQLAEAAAPPRASSEATDVPARVHPNRISPTFAAEYRDLAKRMADAASHDNYASSVSLLIPKTARLRLVSSAKAFYGKLNDREKVAALDSGCLRLLYSWVHATGNGGSSLDIHPHVLEGVLTVLESLPVRKEDLDEVTGFRETLDDISTRADVGVDLRKRCIVVSEKWRELDPPTASASSRLDPSSSVLQRSPSRSNGPVLPAIQAFSSRSDDVAAPTQPKPIDTKRKASGKRKLDVGKTADAPQKRSHEEWYPIAVEYVKAKFYPVYKDSKGAMAKDQFKAVVKQVVERFRGDAASMQSRIVEENTKQLSSIAKKRLMQLLDQVYRESRSSRGSSATLAAPVSARPLGSVSAAHSNATYSAVPNSVKRRRPTTNR